MYKANGLRFENKEEYVKGVADIVWEMYNNSVSDGCMSSLPECEDFVNDVYSQIVGGIADGVWSKMDNDGSSGTVDVPDEIRFLGEEKIKRAIREYWMAENPTRLKVPSETITSISVRVIAKTYEPLNVFNKQFETEEQAREYIRKGREFDSDLKFELEIVKAVREVF